MSTKQRFVLFMTFILSLAALSPAAFARWKSFEEADALKLTSKTTIRINKDGSSVSRRSVSYKILTRKGLREFATINFEYSPKHSSMKLISATVTTDGKRIPVAKKHIEDKPTASGADGFDSTSQLLIAYPNVQIGSVVEYEIEEKRSKPAVEKHFFTTASFGWYASPKGHTLEIESELPLYHHVSGPAGYLDVTTAKKGNRHHFKTSLTKDAYFDWSENGSSFDFYMTDSAVPTVQITTEESWSSLAAKLAPRYEEALRQPIPPEFTALLDEARKQPSFSARADAVHSAISKSLRYMGDWRDQENSLFPRSLRELADTKFGDCKDFALLMTMMLKAMGYSADLVAISQDDLNGTPLKLATTRYFDHMVVRAVDESGRVYWLDPTHQLAFSSGIRMSLANKPVFVLNARSTSLETTSNYRPDDYTIEINIEYISASDKEMQLDYQAKTTAMASATMLKKMQNRSPKEQEEFIVNLFAGERKVINSNVTLPDSSGSTLRPLSMSARLTLADAPKLTSAGSGYTISAELTELQGVDPSKLAFGIDLDEHGVFLTRTVMPAKKLVGRLPENCTVNSRWLTAERTYTVNQGKIAVQSKATYHTPFVTLEQLRSDEFAKLQADVFNCLRARTLIFND